MDVLRRGNTVAHFSVRTLAGEMFSYATIWQRQNLVLAVLSPSEPPGHYVTGLTDLAGELRDTQTTCVITRDPVRGLPAPALLVADRWGEIVHIVTGVMTDDLPPPGDVLDWVHYVSHRCPECEGEAK